MSCPIASFFHMYIDMGERIAGKQDRPSLIIEDSLRAPKIAPKYTLFFTFWPINEKLVFKLFPIVVHMSPLWWGLHLMTFWCPGTPGFYVRAQHDPEKNEIYFIFFIFCILTQRVLIRLLLYLTCKLLLNRGYMWTKMGPVWLWKPPPPPPPPRAPI